MLCIFMYDVQTEVHIMCHLHGALKIWEESTIVNDSTLSVTIQLPRLLDEIVLMVDRWVDG